MSAPAGTYTVTILNNGDWATHGTVMYDNAYPSPKHVKIAMNFFLLEGGGQRILVDTGIDNALDYTTPEQREEFGLTTHRTTVAALAEHGLTPDDIDILIITHLHFDHYVNAPLFNRARIVLNRREYQHVLLPENRVVLPRNSYPREVFAWLVDEAWDRVDLVDGEVEVRPGLRVIWTGGHTPGHQIVVADTTAGPVVIPGDEVYLYEHVESLIPIGNHYDLLRHVETLRRIRALGATVLPAHDIRIRDRHPSLRIGD
ncbi:N-acyl homoserine lactonase family protein [Micromonospora qiuiae]|uniref:N-acyl homoserine lactonase family protein n=1 Tax=Micromonospora qiuiae TaxID=502268 RepID=UPI00194E8F6E|nr:N-acyl homoserine lactonase family protein [Micromonospora qiuiae]